MSEKKYTKRDPQKKKPEVESFDMGKVPPNAIQLEEAVLGALMLEKDTVNSIMDILRPECFYRQAHEMIYSAIVSLFKKSYPIDLLTVTNELKSRGELDAVGGPYFISELTNRIGSGANAEFHARIIVQKYIQREIIRVSTESIREAYSDTTDVFELLDKQYTLLNSITGGIIKGTEHGSAKLFGDFIKQLELMSQSESSITGVPTTLKSLDKLTRGFQKSDFVVIAARPSVGKSSALKNCIKGAIMEMRKPVLLFSLEMSKHQQIQRLMSEDVLTSANSFNSKEFLSRTNFKEINSKVTDYFDSNGKELLVIDDTPALTINELKARAKRVHAERNLCMILVDYIGKMRGSGDQSNSNKVYEIEEIASGLKNLAKELSVPVVCLSQLNRDVEKNTPDCRPNLSHLRSSGAIEQEADLVIFLYRPEVHKKEFLDDGVTSSKGYAEWIIAKNRQGALGTVKCKFIDYLTKFEDDTRAMVAEQDPYDANAGLTPNTDFTQPKSAIEEDPF